MKQGGSYKICNRLAAKIGEEKIHTSQVVDEIIQVFTFKFIIFF